MSTMVCFILFKTLFLRCYTLVLLIMIYLPQICINLMLKMYCRKKFVCHHSSFKKVSSALNKKTKLSKNSNCPASLKIKIKVDTCSSRRNDNFIKVFIVNLFHVKSIHWLHCYLKFMLFWNNLFYIPNCP